MNTWTAEPLLSLTETEVIRQAQQGDAAAFEYLYRAHSRHVYSVCLRMLKNQADAEDLTQQVFLLLFRKIGTFRGDSSFSTWLHRVAVNSVLMHLRQRKPTELQTNSSSSVSADGEPVRELGPGDRSMMDAVERLNLVRAIRRLAPGYRRLLLLHEVSGFKHREIAKIVGCSVGCSKSQVHKARKRLQMLLEGASGPAEQETGSA